MTEIIDQSRLFPDERFTPLEHSGDVDCICGCGQRTNVLTAFRVEHSAGPTGWLKPDHMNNFVNAMAAKVAYHAAVAAAVRNNGHLLPAR